MLLQDIAFVSLDCEFTGLKGKPELIVDTPDERYRNVSEQLLLANR